MILKIFCKETPVCIFLYTRPIQRDSGQMTTPRQQAGSDPHTGQAQAQTLLSHLKAKRRERASKTTKARMSLLSNAVLHNCPVLVLHWCPVNTHW